MSNETEYITSVRYNFIAQHITKYMGLLAYIICIIGTIMNIITFLQRAYNRRACSLYLLVASIFDLAHLNTGSLSNILQYGFHYNWTITSIIYCKLKTYFVFTFTIISGTLTLLATIDRFLLSSTESTRWDYTRYPFARRCITFTIVFWSIVSIPIGFCAKRFYHSSHNEQMVCSNPCEDIVCFAVQIIYNCLFNGCFPPLLMMIFGLLTYINVHHLHTRSRSFRARKINQEITSMLILQSIKSAFASIPYSVFNFYWLSTSKRNKSFKQQAQENLIMQIVYLLFWSNYTSFFIYIYSSDIFRHRWIKTMKLILCCQCENRRRHNNQPTELRRLGTTETLKNS